MFIELSINPIQLSLLEMALRIEIDSYEKYGKVRMTMTKEPALSIYRRLIAEPAGLPVGRGLKGRQQAYQVVTDFMAQIKEDVAQKLPQRTPREIGGFFVSKQSCKSAGRCSILMPASRELAKLTRGQNA